MAKKRRGWFGESKRHELSAHGVKTKPKPEPEYADPIPHTKYGGWWWQPSKVEKAMFERFRQGMPPVSTMGDVIECIDQAKQQPYDDPEVARDVSIKLDTVKRKLKRGQRLSDEEIEFSLSAIKGEYSGAGRPAKASPARRPKEKAGRGAKYESADAAWKDAQAELAERHGESAVGGNGGDEALKRRMGGGAF